MTFGHRWIAGLSIGLIVAAAFAGCGGKSGSGTEGSTSSSESGSTATSAPASTSSTSGSSGSTSPTSSGTSGGGLTASGTWNGATVSGPVTIYSNNCVQATSGGSAVINAHLSGRVGSLQIGLVLNGPAGAYTSGNNGKATIDLEVNSDYGHQPTMSGGIFSIASDLKSVTLGAQFGTSPNQLTLHGTFSCG